MGVLAACGSGDPQTRRAQAPAEEVAPAVASADAHPIDCGPYQMGLWNEVSASEMAANASPHVRKAHELVKATPAACQNGVWHRAAATLLRGSAFPLKTAAGTFKSPKDILARGLARDPKSPELLAYIAQLSSVSPKLSPPLPDDACIRARQAPPPDAEHQVGMPRDDRVAYICAQTAMRAGDHQKAVALFAELHDPGAFLDAQVLWAEALAALGRSEQAKKLARRAIEQLSKAQISRVSPSAIAKLKARAQAVLR